MYVSGEADMTTNFHVDTSAAALRLALYAVGYSIGPLLFAPLSEIAAVELNWVNAPHIRFVHYIIYTHGSL